MPLPQQVALVTPQRPDRLELPLPRLSAPWTPQRRTHQEVQHWPSRTLSTPQCIRMYATSRRDRTAMVGGRGRQTRPPQYYRPGEPAIANHLTRHEVHHQVSRRRVAPDARWPISKLARDRFAHAATVGFRDAATSTARCCRNSKERCTKRCVAERKGRNDDSHRVSPSMPQPVAIRTDQPAWRCGTEERLRTELRHGSSAQQLCRLAAPASLGGRHTPGGADDFWTLRQKGVEGGWRSK